MSTLQLLALGALIGFMAGKLITWESFTDFWQALKILVTKK
jgi:hypothetical protein